MNSYGDVNALVFESTDGGVHVRSKSMSLKSDKKSSLLVSACWSVMLIFALFFVINVAHAEEAGGPSESRQGEDVQAKNPNPKEQNLDGWINCNDAHRSKQAYHDVTFNNCNGSYELKITRGDYQCMYGPGNQSLDIPAGSAYQINLSDNDSWPSCAQTQKYVKWNIVAVGGPSNPVEWHHDYNVWGFPGQWTSQIDSGAVSGPGLPYKATCDGTDCLRTPAYAGSGRPQVIIYFN
ncbi:hypothetical protein [Burkholderia contaminans]|uniref:hypothetical protein n=1 Tax=Burkholderia contaminans TaxID=488447 RepID=UPI000F59D8E4|nr:hypothetical protein [Burkholderia contaminans]